MISWSVSFGIILLWVLVFYGCFVGDAEDVLDVLVCVVEDVGAVTHGRDGSLACFEFIGDPLVDVVDLDDVGRVAEEDVVAAEHAVAVKGVVSPDEVYVDDAWCASASLATVSAWVVDLCNCPTRLWSLFKQWYDVLCDLVECVVKFEESGAVSVV